MGTISECIKDLPMTSIVRVRLLDAETQMYILQKGNALSLQDNAELKKKYAALEAENADLKRQIQKIES